MASSNLILHWNFEEDQSLVDRIDGLTWTLDNGGPTVFVAGGLDAGDGDPGYSITDVSSYMNTLGDESLFTIYLRFTNAGSAPAADAWMLTYAESGTTNNMDVTTVRSDFTFDWVRQRSIAVTINLAGPLLVANTEHIAAYYCSNGASRLNVDGTFAGAVETPNQPAAQWNLNMFRRPDNAALGFYNGVMSEVRVYRGLTHADYPDEDDFIDALAQDEIDEEPQPGGGTDQMGHFVRTEEPAEPILPPKGEEFKTFSVAEVREDGKPTVDRWIQSQIDAMRAANPMEAPPGPAPRRRVRFRNL